MAQVKKVCQRCSKEFFVYPYRATTALYCSRACRYPPEHDIRCQICGTLFSVRNYRKDSAKFCSRSCAAKYGSTVNRQAQKRRFEIQCSYCGTTLQVHRCRLDAYGHLFCSVKHKQRFFSEHPELLNHPLTKIIEKICPRCGKVFTVFECLDRIQYCSRECYSEDHRVDKICPICKKTFTTARSDTQVYCSQDCFRLSTTSSLEETLAQALDNAGISYERQFPFKCWFADFLVEGKVIVECDGEYWHKLEKTKRADRARSAYLKTLPYKILRLPESLILSDIKHCVALIEEKIVDG